MIYRCSDHTRWETRDILSMLQIDRGSAPVISIAGGGGKTTTAFCLKHGFAERKEPVLLTTTTHMRRPTGPEVLLEDSETEFQTKLKKYGWVIAGLPAENGKISSMPDTFLEKTHHIQMSDISDGSIFFKFHTKFHCLLSFLTLLAENRYLHQTVPRRSPDISSCSSRKFPPALPSAIPASKIPW